MRHKTALRGPTVSTTGGMSGSARKPRPQRVAAGEFVSADLIKPSNVTFLKEVDHILSLAAEGNSRAVGLERCVLFSTEDGDAWVLDADDGLALCLSWHGQRQDFVIEENAERFFVGYDAEFMLWEGAFSVRSDNPNIGSPHYLWISRARYSGLADNHPTSASSLTGDCGSYLSGPSVPRDQACVGHLATLKAKRMMYRVMYYKRSKGVRYGALLQVTLFLFLRHVPRSQIWLNRSEPVPRKSSPRTAKAMSP